jgi:hypothetical protein
VQAAGYMPNTLILSPADSEALDTLVAEAGTEHYVFSAGRFEEGLAHLARPVGAEWWDTAGGLASSPIALAPQSIPFASVPRLVRAVGAFGGHWALASI